MNLEPALIGVLATINLLSFFVMGYDKASSMSARSVRRVSEKTLFILALAFGAVGVCLGMLTFRHKTQKLYFKLGIPLLILQNVAALYLLKNLLSNF
jgi:uncharacterized membrane protein YsdA (DUF1294 family)